MRFIVDEDVPQSAAEFLIERGHEVIDVEAVLLPGSADYLIARWAHENGAVVVTCNVRHFRGLLRRDAYSQAGLLGLPQATARNRLERFIALIETEHGGDMAHRLWIEIRETNALLGR